MCAVLDFAIAHGSDTGTATGEKSNAGWQTCDTGKRRQFTIRQGREHLPGVAMGEIKQAIALLRAICD